MSDEDRNNPTRRVSDKLIFDLIDEVKGLREDMKPIREFMDQVSATKTVAIWGAGVLAATGAAITWALNLKDHIHK